MNYLYVAYNSYGDLIAESCSYNALLRKIRGAGYFEDEVVIGRVSP